MKKKLITLVLAFLLTAPLLTLAIDFPPQPTRSTDIKMAISGFVDAFFIIFIGTAVIMFIWAGLLFVLAQGDPTKISTARKAVLWGVVGVGLALLSTSIIYTISGRLF